ncbi:hypothetical protein BB776_04465 [Planococcus salinarum]|uniref:General stress protein 17M-like domain-containing protein n=1 Tax=Planococcus salinarum TaxID=622695 RepID=A0ABX3CVI4_9BACL|nr:general stress protein [Planococcus salinarum]OHX49054.1 hypothetical protein BB776_04465 [Planococcus salinarum]TAA73590.1 hypothetical protein D2909_01730 [Planococcus salinarum]
MNRHFIESYEDEREILRKIEELKILGYAQTDMYVVARSSEQLTRIRTSTDVEYHAAEGKGMGRFGMFIRSRHVFPYILEAEENAQGITELYRHLSEGELLFFYNETNRVSPQEPCRMEFRETQQPADTLIADRHPLFPRHYIDQNEIEKISIDRKHYETFKPWDAQPLKEQAPSKRKQKKH